MKLLKTLTVAALAAASVGTASAQTIIHVAGSTAFRTGTSIAIIDTLAGTTAAGGTGAGSVFAAYSDTSIAGAGKQIFANGTLPGNSTGAGGAATIIIEATWTGSLAGVVDLTAGASAAAFLDETNSTIQTAVNSGAVNTTTDLGGTMLAASPATHSGTVELALSDSNKATIAKELANANQTGTIGSFSPVSGLATALATACGGSTVVDAGTTGFAKDVGVVAVVPFEWVLGFITTPSYTAPTNISQQTARQLLTSGFVQQALFTGGNTTADLQNYFYLEGRNEDSGTRIGALSESQFGVTANPVQFQVGDDASTLSPALPFPAGTPLNTEPLINWSNAGHSGYASGGNVAAALEIANNGSTVTFSSGKPTKNTGASYFLGYLGVTDATKATTGNNHATVLTYNGVAYSPGAVQNGSYTFWTYEHAYRLSSVSGTTLTTVNAIADNLYFTDADATYSTSTGVGHAEQLDGTYVTGSAGLFVDGFLNVSRSTTEGGPVKHN